MSDTVTIPLLVIERDPSDEEIVSELDALMVILRKRASPFSAMAAEHVQNAIHTLRHFTK